MKWRIMVAICLVFMLTGCMRKTDTLDDNPYIVKVMYYSASSFMNEVGERFMAEHPNVLIDVIPFPRFLDSNQQRAAFRDLIHQDRPDLIFLTANIDGFRERIAEGVLLELDSLIQDDQDLRSHYHPGILNAIRTYGNGSIYGLASTFNRSGIYYNTEIFHERNASLPANQMNWSELIAMARQFKGAVNASGQPIIGLYMPEHSSIFSVISEYAATEQLYLTNPSRGLLFDQPSWRTIVTEVITGLREGYILIPGIGSAHDESSQVDFNDGTIAMMLGDSQYLGVIEDVDWDVVTEPVHKSHPDSAHHLRIHLYGIHKETQVLPAAWELLKSIIRSESEAFPDNKSLLYAYKPKSDQVNEYKQEPFYQFQDLLELPEEAVSQEFKDPFAAMAEQYLRETVSGKLDIDTAIQHIQSEGQRLWLSEMSDEEEGMDE